MGRTMKRRAKGGMDANYQYSSNPITRKSGSLAYRFRPRHTTHTPSDNIPFSSNPIRERRRSILSFTQRPSAPSADPTPLSQRQPNLLKCVVAYPDFWSTFIPQCMQLYVSVAPNVGDFFDLSTFCVPITIKQTITAFKHSRTYSLPKYHELTESSKQFKTKFCEDKSEWTTLINTLKPLPNSSYDKNKINLTDLLQLLHMRYRHLLKDPSVEQITDPSVTDEQHKLMESFIPEVQRTLLSLYNSLNSSDTQTTSQTQTSLRTFMSTLNPRKHFLNYLKQSANASVGKIIQPFIDIVFSDICEDPMRIINELFIAMVKRDTPYTFFSDDFRKSRFIQKYINLRGQGGGKKKGGLTGLEAGIIIVVVVVLLVCCCQCL